MRNDKYALHDVQGNTIGLISIGSNITAEHNIAEYRLSLASSGRNLYRYNVKTRAFYDLEKGTDRVSPILIANGPETAIEDGKVAVGSIEKWRNLFRMIDDGIRTGTADIEFREDDGSYTWYRVSFKSILDQDGKPSSAIISYLNVQEHHMSDLDKDIANACVLSSITALYPNFSVSNLTTNVVKPLAFQSTETPGPHRTAEYDATIEALASACVGAHAAAFRDAFSRESLIKAFAAGKHLISSVVNMKYPDGSIHAIECIAIHIKDTPLKDDIISAGLLREL